MKWILSAFQTRNFLVRSQTYPTSPLLKWMLGWKIRVMKRAFGACKGYVSCSKKPPIILSEAGTSRAIVGALSTSKRPGGVLRLLAPVSVSTWQKKGHFAAYLHVQDDLKATALERCALGTLQVGGPLVQVVVHCELDVLILYAGQSVMGSLDAT